jgi:hypothetical protein
MTYLWSIVVGAALGLVLAAPADAVIFKTGNELLDDCRTAVSVLSGKSAATGKSTFSTVFCTA